MAREDFEVYTDDDGYEAFEHKWGGDDIGLWWTLHYDGWNAFIDDGTLDPIYVTGSYKFPSDDDLAEARRLYEEVMNGRSHPVV